MILKYMILKREKSLQVYQHISSNCKVHIAYMPPTSISIPCRFFLIKHCTLFTQQLMTCVYICHCYPVFSSGFAPFNLCKSVEQLFCCVFRALFPVTHVSWHARAHWLLDKLVLGMSQLLIRYSNALCSS